MQGRFTFRRVQAIAAALGLIAPLSLRALAFSHAAVEARFKKVWAKADVKIGAKCLSQKGV